MRFKILCILSITAILCYSCSYKQQHVLFEQKSVPQTDNATPNNIAIPAYRIKPDDILQIRNLQSTKYLVDEGITSTGGGGGNNTATITGQTFQVEEDGKVTLPVIGHVPVAGLTRYEAAKKIEGLYRDSLLKNPIIELKVLNLKVTVLGEIKSQGNYPLLKDKTTLVEVIGQAGGLTNGANEKNIKIIRGGDKNNPVTVDLSDINVLSDPKIILQDNDIVYIAQNRRAIRDDKIQNFSTFVQPSLLILNTALIIYTLFRR
jgi:polysaccharide export outer membrane protein